MPCGTPARATPHLRLPRGIALSALAFAIALAAPAAAAADGRAGAAGRTVSWSVGPLEVVSKGHSRRLAEGTLIEGYTLKAGVRARPGAPVGDGVLVIRLSSFSPAKDLPRQPAGFHYVKGTWRLVADGAQPPASVRHAPDLLEGLVTAALPADPTAGGGRFTLRAQVAPGSSRQVHAGDGALTVNAQLEAELVLTLR